MYFTDLLCVTVLSTKVALYDEYLATITYLFLQTNLPFLMVETSAYFEAYRHVLEGLQEVQGDELPFQRLNIFLSLLTKKHMHRHCRIQCEMMIIFIER